MILVAMPFSGRADQAPPGVMVPGVLPFHSFGPLTKAMRKAHQACGWAKTAKARIAGCTIVIRTVKDSQARAEALDNRGNERAALGQIDLAMADFNQANRLWPEFEGPYIDRAMVRIQQRDAAGAIAEYDGLIRLDPNDPIGFDGRCWVRALVGVELDAALSDCNHAIQMAAYDNIKYEDRAIVWFRRGEMSRVISDAEFALKQSPESARALYLRGLARMALGRMDEGRADVSVAEKADAPAVKFLAEWGLKP